MLNDILMVAVLVMAGLTFILMLVRMTDPLWGPLWYSFSQRIKIRNKCLKDYDLSGHLMEPLMDGLLDSDLYWSIERKTWRYDKIDERLLVVSKLSKDLEQRIKDRYNSKGMKNAYSRACKTLLDYRRKRSYYSFDEEFDELYKKAMEVKKDNCLICDDSGGFWEPSRGSCQGWASCTCKNARKNLFY